MLPLVLLLAPLLGADDAPPAPPREFRAVWVASVANIDWPSRPGLPTTEQQAEALAILDRCRALKLNAVILQVRPQADALYASALEPWSYFLTGRQGQPPEPYYDPLAFWVESAHARGLELHAWLNPYRANHPSHQGELSERSIVRARPELVVRLGDKGYVWMDPALRAVQDHSAAVVLDIVRRYDVDGIHFDDYFYPYPDYNDGRDFPDDASFSAYQRAGGRLSRGDWRRKAVDSFIERVAREVRKAKPGVQFGVSPFGIWRPGHPEGIAGFDAYERLYADSLLWLRKGWVDYFTPQLYWPISRIPQSFPVLLRWWHAENRKQRHLWPGLSLSNTADDAGALEVVNQIQVARGFSPADQGQVLFSAKRLAHEVLSGKLAAGPYAAAALVPRSPWLDKKAPRAPALAVSKDGGALEARWTPRGSEPAFLWVVYTRAGGRWRHEILPVAVTTLSRPPGLEPVSDLAVSAVDRNGNESPRARAPASSAARP
jgi:uncharacterized lipoprotein YddW (UPF0748 family)